MVHFLDRHVLSIAEAMGTWSKCMVLALSTLRAWVKPIMLFGNDMESKWSTQRQQCDLRNQPGMMSEGVAR
jgi:hypothetical protein